MFVVLVAPLTLYKVIILQHADLFLMSVAKFVLLYTIHMRKWINGNPWLNMEEVG